MNFRGLMVAVVVLAILGGVLYWSQHRKPVDENAGPPTPVSPPLLRVDPMEITQLTLKQQEPITLKKEDGKWEITEPRPYPADQEAVASLLSNLSAVSSDRVVEEKASDRKQYGLDPAVVELDITGKKSGVRQLLLGDDTPAGGDVYAALASSPRVFTVASYNKTGLAKSLNDLRDKRLLTLSADKVSKLELIKKGQDLAFNHTKDGWQALKPSSTSAVDSSKVDDLVRTLTTAKMDLSGSGDATADFAHAAPFATAKVTGDLGEQTLEVRKSKDDYYAKSSAVTGAYKVDSMIGQALDKKVDDFLKKK